MKLVIPYDVYLKIMHWVDKAGGFEVSGFGTIVRDAKSDVFTVRDAILLKQTNTSAETEIEASAIAKALYELRDAEGEMRWHWHSHHSMDVFWSGTDEKLIRDLGSNGWIVATVFNNKREQKTAFCTYAKSEFGSHEIFHKDVPTQVLTFIDNSLIEAWDKEFDDKVTVRSYHNRATNFGSEEWRAGYADLDDGAPLKPDETYPELDRQSIFFIQDKRFFWLPEKWSDSKKAFEGGFWQLKAEFSERADEIWVNKTEEIETYYSKLNKKESKRLKRLAKQAKEIEAKETDKLTVGLV